MLKILLIRPSKYDDDGYVNHHLWGVLPSNTLSTLNALFRSAADKLGIAVDITPLDESVGLVQPEKLIKKADACKQRVLVGLVGVQTNQFPRALDLARRFRACGAMVVVGGFHVSGTLAMVGESEELRSLSVAGVSLFVGEAEGRVEELLADAQRGTLKARYEMHSYPALDRDWPVPLVDPELSKSFMLPFMGTIDTSRGCVFNCSFCTIINVQGRSMRWRDPKLIEAHIRAHYPTIRYYFFTDDNMARNKSWREIFSSLIAMREEGIKIAFMMQVDTAAYKLPEFVELAGRAGCAQVFIGIESLNQANLQSASKVQNKADRFEVMVEAWHAQGVAVHAAYIIGFPHDSVDSVREDLRLLREEVRPDQASFFMLTPLPGSQDHLQLKQRGEWISPDFNQFDSFHAVSRHPKMSADQWFGLYQEAWSSFYSSANLIKILNRAPPRLYWNIFKNAAWYMYATQCEKQHPMITGFIRLKGRGERRSSLPKESFAAYSWRRTKDFYALLLSVAKLTRTLELVWRRTWLRKRRQELSRKPLIGTYVQSLDAPMLLLRCVRRVSTFTLRLQQTSRHWQLKLGQARAKSFRRTKNWTYAALQSCNFVLQAGTKFWLFLLNYSLET